MISDLLIIVCFSAFHSVYIIQSFYHRQPDACLDEYLEVIGTRYLF